jgi:hypothetical protein
MRKLEKNKTTKPKDVTPISMVKSAKPESKGDIDLAPSKKKLIVSLTISRPPKDRCLNFATDDIPKLNEWLVPALNQIFQSYEMPISALMLPAGFFLIRAYSLESISNLASAIYRSGLIIPIVTTIDAENIDAAPFQHLYHSFGVVLQDGSVLGTPVQQAYASKNDKDKVTDQTIQEIHRVQSVNGIKIGLLCCGEILCPDIKNAVARHHPNITVNMVHRCFDYPGSRTAKPWDNCLKLFSKKIEGWSIFTGPSQSPETKYYNYCRGRVATKNSPVEIEISTVKGLLYSLIIEV